MSELNKTNKSSWTLKLKVKSNIYIYIFFFFFNVYWNKSVLSIKIQELKKIITFALQNLRSKGSSINYSFMYSLVLSRGST